MRRVGTGLVWRAIRWRLGSSMMFLAVGAAAVAAASAGPIYLASADQSALQSALAGASQGASGITLTEPEGSNAIQAATLARLAAEAPGGSGSSGSDRYAPAIVTVDVAAKLFSPKSGVFDGVDILSRTGACANLHIVAGSCPAGPDQVLLSTRSARALGTAVGRVLVPVSSIGAGHRGPSVTVSGLYIAPTRLSSFWWGSDYFDFGTPDGRSSQFIDSGFVTEAGALRLVTKLPAADLAQLALRPGTIAATGTPAVIGALNRYGGLVQSHGLVVTSGLAAIFSSVATEEHQMADTTAVISLELVLLALLVLYGVASANSDERSPDLEIAELRGLSRSSMAVLALREPAVLLAVSAPAGIAIAWVLVALAGARLFPGVPVRVDSLTIGAVLVTLVAGCAATAIGARRLVSPRTAAAGQDRASKEKRSARAAITIDAIVVVLAVAALVEVLSAGKTTRGRSDPIAAFAPALLALTAGILGARIIPLVCRLIARATSWSGAVAGALACRSLMRRPGVARRVLMLSLALGLLTFAVSGSEVASANRATQSAFVTGAPVVLAVTVPSGVNFLTAVRKADPTGHEAMAVVKISTSNGSTLAVDSERFGSIASWPAGTTSPSTTASSIGRYLNAGLAPPLELAAASAVRLDVRLAAAVRPAPHLEVSVFDERFDTEDVIDLGPLKTGEHAYTSGLQGGCLTRCRFDSFEIVWTPSEGSSVSSVKIPLLVSRMLIHHSSTSGGAAGGSWAVVRTGFDDPRDWTSDPSVVLAPGPAGLGATFFVNASSALPSVQRHDLPAALPAVVTTQVAALNQSTAAPGQYPADGLDGNQLTVAGHVQAQALPGVGANGILIDLSSAEAAQTGNAAALTYQVWCRSQPSPALLARLSASGVTVRNVTTSTSALAGMDKSGPALAFDLFVLAAGAAGVLALGSLLFAIAAASRRRSIELAALVAVGVPRRVLWRSLVEEYGGVVLAGVVLGLVSGTVAVTVALGSLPEFPNGRVGPALTTWVPWGPVLVTTGAALVILLLAAIVATRLLMHRVTPDCLRVSA